MKPFALALEPMDAVLTIHFHNYEYLYGKDSFVARMNYVLAYGHLDYVKKEQATMWNFLQTYGEGKIKSFLTEFKLAEVA